MVRRANAEVNYGRAQLMNVGDGPRPVLDWHPEESEQDRPPRIVCVTMFTDQETPATGFPARAIVEWGAGGVTHNARFDILRGTQITIPASSLRVSASWNSDGVSPIVPDPSIAPVFVSAILGFGIRPSGIVQPQFTSGNPRVSLAPAGTAIHVIPSFAKYVTLWTADSVGGNISMEYFANVDATTTLTIVKPNSVLDKYPIPYGARAIQLTNNNAGNTTMCLIFELGL